MSMAARRAAPPSRPNGLRMSRLLVVVAVSIGAGAAAGFSLGSRTGVKNALQAAQSIDGQTLAKALDWKPEVSFGLEQRREIARLLDEARATRALIESLRHDEEALRAGARLRALETARDSGASRLERLEQRLDRLDSARIDPAPTGSLPKGEARRDSRAAPMGAR
ncbi:hypothetical protein A1351_13865 [Methylosinus sp. R-45379]|nr:MULTISPECIES: hypothetical protein [unclassified Methylosinus]OAI27092.1 hypothetical protein A1351_13865 [Methylosinus sp. R-45379]TDX64757.1 hypothetical protein EDE12_10447 [Methylosinus sp. sav-2]